MDPDVNTSCVPTFKAYRVEFATHNIFEYAQIGKAVPPEFELKCVHSLVIDKKLFKTVGAKQIKNKFEPCKTCQSVDEINQKSQILKFEKGRTA